jgi:hypothetical protein
MRIKLPFGATFYLCGRPDTGTSLGLSIASGPAGAQLETLVESRFRSDHLVAALGEENRADQFRSEDGELFYGRTTAGVDDCTHSVSAETLARQAAWKKAKHDLKRAAKAVDAFSVKPGKEVSAA